MTHAIIIDDQSSNIGVLAVLLEQQGVSYTGMSTPQVFVEEMKSLPAFDVVFLDLEIPGFDMYEQVQYFKTFDALEGIPIVAYSVHTSEIDVARKVGFDGFLGKPLDAYDFPQQLARILNQEAVWDISV